MTGLQHQVTACTAPGLLYFAVLHLHGVCVREPDASKLPAGSQGSSFT
jgi:hypothetical protein